MSYDLLDYGLKDRVTYPPGHQRPTSQIIYSYPTSGGNSFSSNGNKNMKFWLPRGSDLVIVGQKLALQFDAVFGWSTFTPVVASSSSVGLWMPASASSIFSRFRVRVGSVYVHDITSNYGLLKRKLYDLLARYDWIQSHGVIKEGYVCDPDSLSGFAGAAKLLNLNGTTVTTTVAKSASTSTARRYQVSFLPHGWLNRHLPMGSLRGPIEIELELDTNVDSFMTYNIDSGLSSGNVYITITNPKIMCIAYQDQYIHAAVDAEFRGGFYFNDFVSFPGQNILANATSATLQYSLSRKSISGIINVFRIAADMSKTSSTGTLGSASGYLDKMGQCLDMNLSKWYYRFNGRQLPDAEPLENNNGVMSYTLAQRFAEEYMPNIYNQDCYNCAGGQFTTQSLSGGASPSSNPWFTGSASAYSRFTLYHSFRSDTGVLCGLNTSQSQNLLEVVLQTITAPNSLVQVDAFIRCDSFCRMVDGGVIDLVV
jgi:hypothetical protein